MRGSRRKDTQVFLVTMLREVAEDLASAVESGSIPRAARSEARRLLLEAWNLASAASRRFADNRHRIRALLVAMDRIVTESRDADRRSFRLHLAAHPTCLDLSPARVSPIEARVMVFETANAPRLRRIHFMVEQALRSGRSDESVRRPAPAAGREDLELVWGETEG